MSCNKFNFSGWAGQHNQNSFMLPLFVLCKIRCYLGLPAKKGWYIWCKRRRLRCLPCWLSAIASADKFILKTWPKPDIALLIYQCTSPCVMWVMSVYTAPCQLNKCDPVLSLPLSNNSVVHPSPVPVTYWADLGSLWLTGAVGSDRRQAGELPPGRRLCFSGAVHWVVWSTLVFLAWEWRVREPRAAESGRSHTHGLC